MPGSHVVAHNKCITVKKPHTPRGTPIKAYAQTHGTTTTPHAAQGGSESTAAEDIKAHHWREGPAPALVATQDPTVRYQAAFSFAASGAPA